LRFQYILSKLRNHMSYCWNGTGPWIMHRAVGDWSLRFPLTCVDSKSKLYVQRRTPKLCSWRCLLINKNYWSQASKLGSVLIPRLACCTDSNVVILKSLTRNPGDLWSDSVKLTNEKFMSRTKIDVREKPHFLIVVA
jgi:hypothetical protein